jgi:ABC-type bacteriocin/lantibiotic exporter with double-glycine peptidase domain
VAHLRFIHFVVVEGLTPTHVLINDPHAGRSEMALETFSDGFTGIVLTFAPSARFVRDGSAIAPLRSLAKRIGAGAYMLAALALAAGVALPLPVILAALVLGTLVDRPVGSAGVAAQFVLAGLAGPLALRVALFALQSAALSGLQRSLSLTEARAMARHLLYGAPPALAALYVFCLPPPKPPACDALFQ